MLSGENREWTSLLPDEPVYEHQFKGGNSCYTDAQGAMFYWSSTDAVRAQQTLDRRVTRTKNPPAAVDLIPGQRARFFHPGTLGVMFPGVVRKIRPEGVVVTFDAPQTNGRRTFTVPPDHLPCK